MTENAETPLQILQRLEGGAELTVRKGPDGKFLPKDAAPATTTESPEKPVASPVKADESAKETTANPDMGKALTALRRARTPQSVIDKLTDTERLEWGAALAAEQAKTDRLYREKGKDPASSNGAPANAADATDGEEGSPSPETEAEQVSDPVAFQMRDILATQARTQLAGDFPQLNDPKVWVDVRAAALDLFESGAYDDHSEDWSETALVIISDALASTKHRPSPTAPSPARSAGHAKTTKSEDAFEGLRGIHPGLMRLKLMEDHGLSPERAYEVAKRLGA